MKEDPEISPPNYVVRVLKRVLTEKLFDSVYGDLCEDFTKNYELKGKRYAKWIFLIESLGFAWRSRKMNRITNYNQNIMNSLIPSFAKTTVRYFRKNRSYFFFNLIGLSIGLASSIIILQYVNFQKSFDSFHKDGIYRVARVANDGTSMANGAADMANTLQDNIAQVTGSTRFFQRKDATIRVDDSSVPQTFKDVNFLYADNQFLDLFSFSKSKNLSRILDKPNSIIITEALARKAFGYTDVVGEVIEIKETNFPLFECKVAEVIPDVPKNSRLQFDALVSINTIVRDGKSIDQLGWSAFNTYVELGVENIEEIEEELSDFAASYFDNREEFSSLEFQPLRDIYLNSRVSNEVGLTGDSQLVDYFSLAALFILIMAYVNYINLATAQSIDRSKEIGIRKVLGSKGRYVKAQILIETLILNLIALIGALAIIIILERIITIDGVGIFNLTLEQIGVILGVILIGSCLSGFYPAQVLGVLRPISVLNNKLFSKGGSTSLRSILTLVQFSISTLMLVITLVVTNQIQYMINHNNGVSLDQVLIVKPPSIRSGDYRQQIQLFKNKLDARSFIESVSTSSATPGLGYNYSTQARLMNSTDEQSSLVYVDGIDENFINHYELELLTGRSFDRSFSGERGRVVINETASATFGFQNPSEAISKQLVMEWDTLEIIGVLSDYNHRSLNESYDAQVFAYYGNYTPHFSIKINAESTGEILSHIKAIEKDYEEVFAENAVDFFFLDDKFNEQYKKDIIANQVSWYFTIISLTITVIGLIGFISYTLSRRLKEVAIRRVLGAMKRAILLKLATPIVKILVITAIISIIVGYLLADQWLNQYAFRIDISTLHFAVPILIIAAVSALLLIFRSMHTVSQNPVNYLRNE